MAGRGGGRRDAGDGAMLNAFWHKAIALLDDRERHIDTAQCVLPPVSAFFSSPPWELSDVSPVRAELDEAKGRLDDLDNTAWDKMASDANYSDYVRRDLRKTFQVELATVAWAKMYEMLVRHDLLPCDKSTHDRRQQQQQQPSQQSLGGSGGRRAGQGSNAASWRPRREPDTEQTGDAGAHPSGGPSDAGEGPAVTEGRAGSPGRRSLLSVHLCEAPGGFVAATNHFLRTQRPGWSWDWLAVSLNPYYGGNDQFCMVDDDAFMRATLDHWSFGADDSGDVRRPHNIAAVWAEARRRCPKGAALVTADGAIDTSMNPSQQEAINASLHFAEVVAALGLLAPGGSFLWKGFVLLEHSSLCLVYLMGCLFDSVAVCKPCTSKAANSEVYVVGRGFRGVDRQLLELLLARCGEDAFRGRAIFPLDLLPAPFLDSCLSAAAFFARCTADAIADALSFSGLPPAGPTASALRRCKERFAAEWFLRMQLVRLERRSFVAPHEMIDGSNNSTSNVLGRRRELLGTLQERQEQYRKRRSDLGLDAGAMGHASYGTGCRTGISFGGGGGGGGGSRGWCNGSRAAVVGSADGYGSGRWQRQHARSLAGSLGMGGCGVGYVMGSSVGSGASPGSSPGGWGLGWGSGQGVGLGYSPGSQRDSWRLGTGAGLGGGLGLSGCSLEGGRGLDGGLPMPEQLLLLLEEDEEGAGGMGREGEDEEEDDEVAGGLERDDEELEDGGEDGAGGSGMDRGASLGLEQEEFGGSSSDGETEEDGVGLLAGLGSSLGGMFAPLLARPLRRSTHKRPATAKLASATTMTSPSPSPPAPVAPTALTPPEAEPSLAVQPPQAPSAHMHVSYTAAKLMAKMGYVEGSGLGLGRHRQGIAAAVPAVGNAGRAGLGLGTGATAGLGLGPGLAFSPGAPAAASSFATGSGLDASGSGLLPSGAGGGGGGFGAAGLGFGSRSSGCLVGGPEEGCHPGLGYNSRRGEGRGGAAVAPGVGGSLQPVAFVREGAAAAVRQDSEEGAAATGSAVAAPGSERSVQPDSRVLLNERPLTAEEVAGWGPGFARQAVPAKLTKSKMVVDDAVLVGLRRAREAYLAAAEAAAAKGPVAMEAAAAEGAAGVGAAAGMAAAAGAGVGVEVVQAGVAAGGTRGACGVQAGQSSDEAGAGADVRGEGGEAAAAAVAACHAGLAPKLCRHVGAPCVAPRRCSAAATDAAARVDAISSTTHSNTCSSGSATSSSDTTVTSCCAPEGLSTEAAVDHPNAERGGGAEDACMETCAMVSFAGAGGSLRDRSYWKLASLDAALGVCSYAAAAVQPGETPVALDLSLRSAGAAEYLVTRAGHSVPTATQRRSGSAGSGGDGAGEEGGGRAEGGSGGAGNGEVAEVSGSDSEGRGGVRGLSCGSTTSSVSMGPGQDGEAPRSDGGSDAVDLLLEGSSSSGRSSSTTSDHARPAGADGECPSAAAAAAAAAPPGGCGDGTARDAAASSWSCLLLPTSAAHTAVRQHSKASAQGRLRLCPNSPCLQNNDCLPPLSHFTAEAAQSLMYTLSSPPAETQADGANPPSHTTTQPVHLVVGDLTSLRHTRMGYPTPAAGPMEHEYDTLYRRRLLYEAAVGLSYTAPGGCLVLRLGDCLTMFTASVLYLLHRGFGQLALVKPFASCACSEERFVVCMGRLEDGGVAAGVVLSALRAAEELEGPGVGEVGLGADGLVAGAEAEAEATREDKVEGDEAGRLARDEGLRARGGQPAEREAGQMAGAGEEHDAAGEPGPGAAAAGGADARVPLPATEALVLAGVVPPSVCVCGPFYVYLAGRTQELARRQAAACEAAVRRAVAGAGKEGEEGAVACTPAEVQVEDAMARVRIVRQAEAALAEALDDGRRRAAMGPLRSQSVAHAASCTRTAPSPAPHQPCHDELPRRHRTPFTREGPGEGAHSPGAGFGDRRGRSGFVVGSAPMPRPTWARGPPICDRPSAAAHGVTAGSGGDYGCRLSVSPPAAADAAARVDGRGGEGSGLGAASGGAQSPAVAHRGRIAEAGGGGYRCTGAQDSGRPPYCHSGSMGGFISLAKRDSPGPRECGAGGRDAAGGRSHVQGAGGDARDGSGHVPWGGRVGRQPGSGNYERRPSAGLHQGYGGGGGYGATTPSSSYKYGGWAGGGTTAASWRAAPPPPPPPSSVGASSPPSVIGSLSAAKTPSGGNTPYGTSPPTHGQGQYYSSSWQRTSAVWGHQAYGSSQQGGTGGSHGGGRGGGHWDRDRDRDRDRGGGTARHANGQGQGQGHHSLRCTAGGEDASPGLLGTSAPVDVPSHMHRARGPGRRGGSPAGVHGDVPSLGASPPAVGGSCSERGHGLAWPGRGHVGRKGAGAGPGGSPAPQGSIAAAAGGAGSGACARAAVRRERSGKGPRSFAEAACACAEAVQVEVEPGWELVSHGRRGARVPQSAC